MVKILKEGRLLELVSKDALAETESDSEEEDAAYAEGEEKDSTRLPKEYTLQGSSNAKGDSMDGTPPSALELATLRPVVGHSVEDVPLLDCDKRSDGGATLPTHANSGRDANPACHDGLHAGKPSGPRDTESSELGPQPLSKRVGVKSLTDASTVEETETKSGSISSLIRPLTELNIPTTLPDANP